jgi:hypothetical protein
MSDQRVRLDNLIRPSLKRKRNLPQRVPVMAFELDRSTALTGRKMLSGETRRSARSRAE